MNAALLVGARPDVKKTRPSFRVCVWSRAQSEQWTRSGSWVGKRWYRCSLAHTDEEYWEMWAEQQGMLK